MIMKNPLDAEQLTGGFNLIVDEFITNRRSIECPQHLETALSMLQLEWDASGKPNNPFGNNGSSFKSPVFEVHSYSWSDEDQPFNFKCGEITVSWYKYFGRGMTVNRQVSVEEALALYRSCTTQK
jgi:hypothetical protein